MALYFLELFVGLTILVIQILVTPEILFYPLLTDISDVPYCIYTITKINNCSLQGDAISIREESYNVFADVSFRRISVSSCILLHTCSWAQ